ncbi:MAG TPA: cytochrome c oxidase subunit II [Candidatus Hydrogenedentes bacterium]|nr:cytochrome c oxidase subunit II [Candidatus Hydrogenedentota bacterium]HNT87717.1 cytochrome c oxidase subunit II [Candidatus Hydrogenedentota bacterium]
MIDFRVLPEKASTFAESVDPLYWFLILFVGGFFLVVCAVVLYWGVKYRQRPEEDRPSYHPHAIKLEIAWTVVLVIIALGIFVWGSVLFFRAYDAPDDALEISVMGKQWMWKIRHPNGMRETNELHVPVDTPVRLTMTSQDVIHSFFIPAFRLKQDVLPAKYTTMWFKATKTGEYPLFCAEYCGTEHSTMGGRVFVMEPEAYAAWLRGEGGGEAPDDVLAAGRRLYDRLGCAACHTAGVENRGPLLEGIHGTTVEMTTGETVVVNDEYLRESILNPSYRVVKGYAPLMPSYKNQLEDEELMNLIAYIKSLPKQQVAIAEVK